MAISYTISRDVARLSWPICLAGAAECSADSRAIARGPGSNPVAPPGGLHVQWGILTVVSSFPLEPGRSLLRAYPVSSVIPSAIFRVSRQRISASPAARRRSSLGPGRLRYWSGAGLGSTTRAHRFARSESICETTPHLSARLSGELVERRHHPRSVPHGAGADRQAAATRDPSAPRPRRSALTSKLHCCRVIGAYRMLSGLRFGWREYGPVCAVLPVGPWC